MTRSKIEIINQEFRPIPAILFAAFIVLGIVLSVIGSCSRFTIETGVEHLDYSGNLIKNCTLRTEDNGSSALLEYSFDRKHITDIVLNDGLTQWEMRGKPESEIAYRCYYFHTDEDDRIIKLYTNGKDICWEVPLSSKYTETEFESGLAFLDEESNLLDCNSFTGKKNSESRQDRINEHPDSTREYAIELVQSIDYNYFADISGANTSKHPSNNGGSGSATIQWSEASAHIGETVTAVGEVMTVEYVVDSDGQPTFIDIGASYPDQNRLTVVIWGEDRGNFPEAPESLYGQGDMRVIGEIYLYEGICFIKVTEPSQIVMN